MLEEQKNNPLHGVKLEALLTELVGFYGFDILAEQININCFKSNPSIKSSLKFLRKTPWARNKLEAFYLYRFKHLPRPTDAEHKLEPGERSISSDQKPGNPVEIVSGDREFFDDPASGPVFPSKKEVVETRSKSKPKLDAKRSATKSNNEQANSANSSGEPVDPWAISRKREDRNN